MKYVPALTLIFLIILVLVRAMQLKRLGIKAIQFGELDKKDFLIPPFALLLFYVVLCKAFNFPKIGHELFQSGPVALVGAVLCFMGTSLFIYAIISFGRSFRVGLDEKNPGQLITTGAFSISRNPIYTAFGLVLIGIFFIIPNWIILIYVIVGIWLFNRQILLEEESLRKIYGKEYDEYCSRVGRYLF